MSTTPFVLMYNPTLGNRQAKVSLKAVDDWARTGWLLVDGQTPAPTNTFLTPAAGDLRYLQPTQLLDGNGKVLDGHLPARLADSALRAAFVAGGVLNKDGTVNTSKKLMARLTADGTDIDDLFIATVA